MRQSWIKITALAMAFAFLIPASLLAQDDKDKVAKEEKEKTKEKKESEQIIITRKGDIKQGKMVIEINGDKITVNGKPLDEFSDGEVTVNRKKIRDVQSYYNLGNTRVFNSNDNFKLNENFNWNAEESNHAMLGVTTEKTEQGAKINSITKESAAEKIGLKEGDVITKINDTKIEDPDGLSKAVRSHKPGAKVNITYLRDNKEQNATAELTKWKSSNFKLDMGDLNLGKVMPKIQAVPRAGQNFVWQGGSPKLGLSVQDTDEGKGVIVIEVDEESNAAKAGVKENDVISEVDGKAVNSTDEMVKIIKESKEKNSIMVKLTRGGKVQNIEVKMPKKIKVADM